MKRKNRPTVLNQEYYIAVNNTGILRQNTENEFYRGNIEMQWINCNCTLVSGYEECLDDFYTRNE